MGGGTCGCSWFNFKISAALGACLLLLIFYSAENMFLRVCFAKIAPVRGDVKVWRSPLKRITSVQLALD